MKHGFILISNCIALMGMIEILLLLHVCTFLLQLRMYVVSLRRYWLIDSILDYRLHFGYIMWLSECFMAVRRV